MSTLAQLADGLPNGLHDAMVRSCSVDFVGRQVTLELDVWVGEMVADREQREARRSARIVLGGLVFLQIEAPDSSYPFARPEPITVDLCDPASGCVPRAPVRDRVECLHPRGCPECRPDVARAMTAAV